MRSTLLIIALLIISNITAQEVLKESYDTTVSMSQKYGINKTEGEYKRTMKFKGDSVFYKGRENVSYFQKYKITKETDKYVIGTNKEGHYFFYNQKNQMFITFDFYMERYLLNISGPKEVKRVELIKILMKKFDDGYSQKDVINYLINQVEYDF